MTESTRPKTLPEGEMKVRDRLLCTRMTLEGGANHVAENPMEHT